MTNISEPHGVAVTGIGVVSAIGNSVDEFWASCLAGKVAAEKIPEEWNEYYEPNSVFWSPLELPDYSNYGLKRSDQLRYDISVLNCVVAADDALKAAKLEKVTRDARAGKFSVKGVDRDAAGVFVGTGLGCITSAFNNYVPHLLSNVASEIGVRVPAELRSRPLTELLENCLQHSRVNPFASCKSMANAISSALSLRYGFRGPNEVAVYACAAGTAAITRAFKAIRTGEVQFALAGGSEFYGDRAGGVFMAFDRLKTLTHESSNPNRASRPFDRERSGFLFSQGASCILAMELEERALDRGATPIATIIGAANTSDAYSMVAMSEDDNAIEPMILRALADARIAREDINYINAHGTATEQNDEIEASILEGIFGNKPYVNSTKSLIGHTVGASGALEV